MVQLVQQPAMPVQAGAHSGAAVVPFAEKKAPEKRQVCLFPSPLLPPAAAENLRRLAALRPQVARVAEEEEEGALHVLPTFEMEEVSALEKRRCRVIGLPFAERLLKDPGALSKVPGLPLFDVIYKRQGSVCCTGLQPAQRLRCRALAVWMGASWSENLAGPKPAGLLVAGRVSLHPESKYQAALAKKVPVVRLSYLEAMWAGRRGDVDVSAHALPALAGLPVCFDPRQGDIIEEFREKTMRAGAILEPLDRAEVVIVKDTFAKLYHEAKNGGLLTAPPAWLAACLRNNACIPIAGELEVSCPKSLSLALYDGDKEGRCSSALEGCVLCLLYLPQQHLAHAKYLAWRCSAHTTLDPLDRAVTHVLFRISRTPVQVSVPLEEERVSFLDLSWLEACAEQGRRLREASFAAQSVIYNPGCDDAHAKALKHLPAPKPVEKAPQPEPAALPAPPQQPALPAPQQLPALEAPLAREPATRLQPTARGLFAGSSLAFSGWPLGDAELLGLVEAVRSQGGIAVFGGQPAEALADQPLDYVVCRHYGPSPFSTAQRVQLASQAWLRACLAEGLLLAVGSFPHFEPGPGTLPMADMAACSVRITALDASSHKKRLRFEELALALGAKVAQQSSRWSQITHVVCAVPELADRKVLEGAVRRGVPVVSVQWLFDCFRMHERRPEQRYSVAPAEEQAAIMPASQQPSAASFAASVLAGQEVLISPSALGSNAMLPRMASELGARVQTWQCVEELRGLLDKRGIRPAAAAAAGERPQVVVLVDVEEVRVAGTALPRFAESLGEELRTLFLLPTWLSETYQQGRRMPLEAFAALPRDEGRDGEPESKRQRLDEATYAWEPAELKRLEELAEDSRAREMLRQAQQKASEGLRLAAELKRAPRA